MTFGLIEFALVFSTFWFWAPIVFLLICTFTGVYREHSWFPGLSLAILVAFFAVATEYNPFAFMYYHPFEGGMYVLGYLIAGAIWGGIIKWYFYLLNRRDEAREIKLEWAKSSTGLGDDDFTEWLSERVNGNRNSSKISVYGYKASSYPPKVLENKARILFWISYWPFSVFWTVLNDPLRRIAIAIFNVLSKIMQRMSNRVFKDI